MQFVDSHCHLYPPHFEDIDSVLEDARASGITTLINVPETPTDARLILSLYVDHPALKPSLGLHPVTPLIQYDETRRLQELEEVTELIRMHHNDIVSIGEVGLDFSPHVTDHRKDIQKNQEDIFRRMIALAIEYRLPLNVHSRSAGRPALNLIREVHIDHCGVHAP